MASLLRALADIKYANMLFWKKATDGNQINGKNMAHKNTQVTSVQELSQEDTDVSKVGVLVKEFTFLNGKWDFA